MPFTPQYSYDVVAANTECVLQSLMEDSCENYDETGGNNNNKQVESIEKRIRQAQITAEEFKTWAKEEEETES